jgi:hypothetical protein
MKNSRKFFSPNFMAEFRKWMHDHDQDGAVFSPGQYVNTEKKLKVIVEKIDCLDVGDNNVFEVSKYFLKNGGKVVECKGDQVIIKNRKGTFSLPVQDLIA